MKEEREGIGSRKEERGGREGRRGRGVKGRERREE